MSNLQKGTREGQEISLLPVNLDLKQWGHYINAPIVVSSISFH